MAIDTKKAHQATRQGPYTIQVAAPASVKEIQARDNELVNRGFSMEMLYGGNPKVDFYRHSPAMKASRPGQPPRIQTDADGNPDGNVGKLVPNQPGDPDTAMKLSARGLLPWLPGPQCQCKACREEHGTEYTGEHVVRPSDIGKFAQPGNLPAVDGQDEQEEPPAAVEKTVKCLDCRYRTKPGKDPVLSLRAHRRKHSKAA
jgi:hypothetical protein